MSDTVNHHFIPQFYLRGFSNGGDKRKAQVFVFDQLKRKIFTTLVRNIGARRNFFRIDIEGYDPNHVEDGMAIIESEIAVHLADVIKARAFPSDAHYTSVMHLMGNVAVRNPRFRSMNEGFHRQIVDRMLKMTLQDKDRYTYTVNQPQLGGAPINGDISYEKMKDLIDRGGIEIAIDQSYLISLELNAVLPVVEQLAKRSWAFATAVSGTSFATCDDPVVLDWVSGKDRGGLYSPGFGLKDTIVMFPLSAELALIGLFSEQPPNWDFRREQVAAFNTSIAGNATMQIYARDGEFELHTRTEPYTRGKDLTAVLGCQGKKAKGAVD